MKTKSACPKEIEQFHVTSFFVHVHFTAAMLVYYNVQYSIFTALLWNSAGCYLSIVSNDMQTMDS